MLISGAARRGSAACATLKTQGLPLEFQGRPLWTLSFFQMFGLKKQRWLWESSAFVQHRRIASKTNNETDLIAPHMLHIVSLINKNQIVHAIVMINLDTLSTCILLVHIIIQYLPKKCTQKIMVNFNYYNYVKIWCFRGFSSIAIAACAGLQRFFLPCLPYL